MEKKQLHLQKQKQILSIPIGIWLAIFYFQFSQNDQVSGLYFYEIFFVAALLYENSKAVSKVRAKGVCC